MYKSSYKIATDWSSCDPQQSINCVPPTMPHTVELGSQCYRLCCSVQWDTNLTAAQPAILNKASSLYEFPWEHVDAHLNNFFYI